MAVSNDTPAPAGRRGWPALKVARIHGVLIDEGSPLFTALAVLARDARLVFFAGLPGTGKSLLLHQLAHLAHARGRRIHLLQWDVARPVFEASEAGPVYPQDRASRTA